MLIITTNLSQTAQTQRNISAYGLSSLMKTLTVDRRDGNKSRIQVASQGRKSKEQMLLPLFAPVN